MPNAIRLSELKVGAIINTSSGGYDLESEQKMIGILNRAGIVEAETWCVSPEAIKRSFAEAAEQKLEVLIVLGGDGTIRGAAEACAEKGLYLIPLPGGTMNMLPRALYGDVSWEEALKKTLTAPSVKFFLEVESPTSIFSSPLLWGRLRCGQNRANRCAKGI